MQNNQSFKMRALSGKMPTENEILELFRFQYIHGNIYRAYCMHVGIRPETVSTIKDIPFLPIHFFKTHTVTTASSIKGAHIFESSGTTGQQRSKHYVVDVPFYAQNSLAIFEKKFGTLHDFVILALLPSYVDRPNASLVYMVNHFIAETHDEASGFYAIEDIAVLNRIIEQKHKVGKKILLWGVTYALLDVADRLKLPENALVIETGGMKGRRREMIKEELYTVLKEKFQIAHIYSEYGMTELLSQAYAKDGIFSWPTTMMGLVRDITDPLLVTAGPSRGALNVIDTANVDSCAFVATDDLVRIHPNGSFEILGRSDNSEWRGCNLLL